MAATARATPLGVGEPAPWFEAPTPFNPRFEFSMLGGRYVVLAFVAAGRAPGVVAAVDELARLVAEQAPEGTVLFGVTSDAADLAEAGLAGRLASRRLFLDEGGRIAQSFGLVQAAPGGGGKSVYRPHWLLLDPQLRVAALGPLNRPEALGEVLCQLPPPGLHAGVEAWAPVLLVPRVLEPAFCRRLIALYEAGVPEESGFMRQVDGKTVAVMDPSFKRRADYQIAEEPVRAGLRERLAARLIPEIRKAFQYDATRIERYIVACYDAADGGHFRAHRDNTTKGTAHRRFAVTINLNAEAFEGGELSFPEFGPRRYKAPTGAAIVFSCSLLHEVAPVTRGRRFATLPFLYDEAAAEERARNNVFLGEEVGRYREKPGTVAAAPATATVAASVAQPGPG